MRGQIEVTRFAQSITVSVLLAACNDVAGPPPTLQITTASLPALCIGDSSKLQATVSGAANTRVRWRSSAPLFASVDSGGLVRGVSAGSAWILALALADSSARDSSHVDVASAPTLNTLTVRGAIGITRHNTQTVVNSTDVSGSVDVIVTFDAPQCARLSLVITLNDQSMCQQTLLPTHGTALCVLETGEVDAGGLHRYVNGTAVIKAHIVATNDVKVTTTTLPIVLNNAGLDPALSCASATAVNHAGTITTEAWHRSAHIIRDSVVVTGALTIDPGAMVCNGAGARIVVVYPSGVLTAHGTAAAPITFTAINASQPWEGILARSVPCPSCQLQPSLLSNALLEYARNAVIGPGVIRVDSSHFRQIRCVATDVAVLMHSTIDTAGIDRCTAVMMGSVSTNVGVDSFVMNTIRGSGGVGLGFYTKGLSTSGQAGGKIVLQGGRIENSQSTGLYFDSHYVGDILIDARPLRILGSRGNPVNAPLPIVLHLWPTRSAQDSLLDNPNDTLVVWGIAVSGEMVARPGVTWRFEPNIHLVYHELGAATSLRIEPGGYFAAGSTNSIRLSGAFESAGTASQPARISGGFIRLLCESACRARNTSYTWFDNVYLSADANRTFDHLTATNSAIDFGQGSQITNSVLSGSNPAISTSLSIRSDTRIDSTVIRDSKHTGLVLSGDNITITNSTITGNEGNGVSVNGGTNVQIHNSVFENNVGVGVSGGQSNPVDARFNWWGDPAGPMGPSGDGVSGNVDFSGFLTVKPVLPNTVPNPGPQRRGQ